MSRVEELFGDIDGKLSQRNEIRGRHQELLKTLQDHLQTLDFAGIIDSGLKKYNVSVSRMGFTEKPPLEAMSVSWAASSEMSPMAIAGFALSHRPISDYFEALLIAHADLTVNKDGEEIPYLSNIDIAIGEVGAGYGEERNLFKDLAHYDASDHLRQDRLDRRVGNLFQRNGYLKKVSIVIDSGTRTEVRGKLVKRKREVPYRKMGEKGEVWESFGYYRGRKGSRIDQHFFLEKIDHYRDVLDNRLAEHLQKLLPR